nr:hypothetical protein [Tanacetum cinerariifolium]
MLSRTVGLIEFRGTWAEITGTSMTTFSRLDVIRHLNSGMEDIFKVGDQLRLMFCKQADWRDDTDDKFEDQEVEAHYLYMTQHDNGNYNVFANDREHQEQPEYVNDTYMEEQGDTNITINSLDISFNGETFDQDDDGLAKERDLLTSLIEKL